MDADPGDQASIEGERLEALARIVGELDPGCLERYQPGRANCHVLFDRAWLMAAIFDSIILQHPACLQNAEWYAQAKRASGKLHELYRLIGEPHFTELREDDFP